MAVLNRKPNGAWHSRKRLPQDVRDAYGDLYGQRHEALFHAAPETSPSEARRLFLEWLAEVEGRVSNIRAEQRGEGRALSHRQARALAGEWYEWFVARHTEPDAERWGRMKDTVADALRAAAGDDVWKGQPHRRDDLWREDEALRREVRPVLADVGETAQFLHHRGIVLTNEARDLFLDNLHDDLGAALGRLLRNAEGDYSADKHAERFPKFEGSHDADNGEPPVQLFEAWVGEKIPAHSTVESWRPVFRKMAADFEGRSAASISADEAQHWIRGLVTGKRTAFTVRGTWIRASRTVFGWAAEHKRIPNNPFAGVKVTVPKKIKRRETGAFRPAELRTILKAALAVTDTDKPLNAAQRWVPWLCAYTGARPGEITQLRKADIVEQDGIHALLLTPDAGSIKVGKARLVPLHEHLVQQGFLEFVAARTDGPLFYKRDRSEPEKDPLKAKKPRSVQMRQRLAHWVRG